MVCIKMKGNETFKLAVKTLTSDVQVMMKNITCQMKILIILFLIKQITE